MGKMFLIRPGVLVTREEYLEYLERCARAWEGTFRDPKQAEHVRAKAEEIRREG